jgi:hypothetical protein
MTVPLSERDDLPRFEYYPEAYDARAYPYRGAFESSDQACASCGESRGALLRIGHRPIHPNTFERVAICPWCVASGESHTNLGVFHNPMVQGEIDPSWQGDPNAYEIIPARVDINPFTGEEIRFQERRRQVRPPRLQVDAATEQQITTRTPGFGSIQSLPWWSHCRDAGLYLGNCTREVIESMSPEQVASFRTHAGLVNEGDFTRFLDEAEEGTYMGYLFRCRTCGEVGGSWDCD